MDAGKKVTSGETVQRAKRYPKLGIKEKLYATTADNRDTSLESAKEVEDGTTK